jgi:hypothetical protein
MRITPHRGTAVSLYVPLRASRSASLALCYTVLCCVAPRDVKERSTEGAERQLITVLNVNVYLCAFDTDSYRYQMLIRIIKSENICSPILASLITTISGANQCYATCQTCTHPLAIGWNPCHTTYVPMRERHMRKIEQQMIEAIKESRNWKSGNTSVCYSADYVRLVFIFTTT